MHCEKKACKIAKKKSMKLWGRKRWTMLCRGTTVHSNKLQNCVTFGIHSNFIFGKCDSHGESYCQYHTHCVRLWLLPGSNMTNNYIPISWKISREKIKWFIFFTCSRSLILDSDTEGSINLTVKTVKTAVALLMRRKRGTSIERQWTE